MTIRFPWFALLRVPNLLTVPGDPIAGYLLAAGPAAVIDSRVGLAVLASLCFYAGGLITNDLADVTEDRRDRPARPLPSGLISGTSARNVAVFLLSLALALCAVLGKASLLTGSMLCIGILGYNLGLKRVVIAGPLVMGCCRSLSLCLGATVHGTASVSLVAASGILASYIALVTWLAQREMSPSRAGLAGWMPAAILLAGMAAMVRFTKAPPEEHLRLAGAFFLAFALAARVAMELRAKTPMPPLIGLLISALMPLQSAFCIAAGAGLWSMFFGFVLIALWPLHRLLSRWFYAS